MGYHAAAMLLSAGCRRELDLGKTVRTLWNTQIDPIDWSDDQTNGSHAGECLSQSHDGSNTLKLRPCSEIDINYLIAVIARSY